GSGTVGANGICPYSSRGVGEWGSGGVGEWGSRGVGEWLTRIMARIYGYAREWDSRGEWHLPLQQ
ncbi:MAG: hypothetical protein SWX82_34180, partial [Cyanobacteriota bacterium]|nr:hypothetical protein [Cyanobacteriota bacterium]